MAVTIEGFSVVAQKARIQRLLDVQAFTIPNSTALNDDHIWKCSFMAHVDAEKFLQNLEALGMNVSQGPDSDAVIVNEFDHSIDPYCEWLTIGTWRRAVIAWRTGTHPETVVAREGWDPEVGSGLVFHDSSAMKHLQFVRLDNNVEVFLDKRTGREVYIGRTSTPVDAIFMAAATVIQKHNVTASEPPLRGSAAAEVSKATNMLRQVVSEVPDWWNAQWLYGKGQLALGNYELAYEAFHRAYELEKGVETIPRELAGVCLELRRFDEAVNVAEQAVSLDPSNAGLLGNLSVSYLMARRYEAARKAIDAAIRIAPADNINQTISESCTRSPTEDVQRLSRLRIYPNRRE